MKRVILGLKRNEVERRVGDPGLGIENSKPG
jgi:hypothetical protein